MKAISQIKIISLIILINLSCSNKQEQEKELIRPVKYQKVVPGGGVQNRSFTGTAVSGTEIRLSFKVSGTLNSLKVKIGQEVNKNTLLATVDNSDYVLEYEKSDAAVKNADATEEQTESNFERIRTLYENGSASLSDYESAKAAYESARANESSLKKARKLARAQLAYTNLYAPIKGKISDISVEVNENISSGQQVMVISTEGDLEVNLGVPESFISQVSIQDEVEITFSTLPNQVFRGIVSEVSFSINSQMATYPIVVKIDDEGGNIRPGMAATVKFTQRLTNPDAPDVLLVPTQAIGEDENGNFVYILNATEDFYTVKRQAVTIGELTSSGFEVTEGLAEGDFIATAGLQMLLEGMKVKLYEN